MKKLVVKYFLHRIKDHTTAWPRTNLYTIKQIISRHIRAKYSMEEHMNMFSNINLKTDWCLP